MPLLRKGKNCTPNGKRLDLNVPVGLSIDEMSVLISDNNNSNVPGLSKIPTFTSPVSDDEKNKNASEQKQVNE
jgi:hypothetical protein